MHIVWKVLKWVFGVGLVLVLVLGGAALFLGPAIKERLTLTSNTAVGKPVRIEQISRGELVRTVSAPGFLEPTERISISARISAQIEQLPFDEGDQVAAGDLVVKLDNADLLAQLASAEASLAAEHARYEGARASYVNAVAEWERRQALYETSDVAKSALEQAEAEQRRAESNLRAAEAAIQMAEAGIRRVREDLRYTEITSPIAGVVTAMNAEEGEIVVTGTMNNAGTVIMEIANLAEMIVKVEVDETDIADVRVGQRARVYLNAYPNEEFDGVVRHIALQRTKARDNSDVFIVEVLLNLNGRRLYSGLSASVDIEVETLSEAMLVPSQAVLDVRIDDLPAEVIEDSAVLDMNKTFARIVYRAVDGKAVATPVRVGPSNLRTTALLAGVTTEDRIVTGPYKELAALKHNDAVRNQDEAPASPAPAPPEADQQAAEEDAAPDDQSDDPAGVADARGADAR